MQHVHNGDFRKQVEAFVKRIPRGRLMTYGQLAALSGVPLAARTVGSIAHFGNPVLPWHRVVNKSGGLAAGYPGGRRAHAEHLRAEGIFVSYAMQVDVATLIWWPPAKGGSS